MLKIKLFIYVVFISLFLNGCFKIGYQIEIGSSVESKPAPTSGYYYQSPAYYIK